MLSYITLYVPIGVLPIQCEFVSLSHLCDDDSLIIKTAKYLFPYGLTNIGSNQECAKFSDLLRVFEEACEGNHTHADIDTVLNDI